MKQTDPKTRKPPVYLGPRTWAIIRARYLGGETAQSLAETFGCSKAAIRKRAWREGWTKRALALTLDALEPEAPPTPLDEARAGSGAATDAVGDPTPTEAPADLEPRAAARHALDQAVRLLLHGQTAKAAEAARVAALMARTADRLASGEPPEAEPDDAADLEAVRRKVAAMIDAARAEGMREAEARRG